MTPLPGAHTVKLGSTAKPFFGMVPTLAGNLSNLIKGITKGNLVILDFWPSQVRALFGDHDCFVGTYSKTLKGMYFIDDGARRGKGGYYWITGRIGDVLSAPGHRMGTTEMGSAMVAHPRVAETAVIGTQHGIRG